MATSYQQRINLVVLGTLIVFSGLNTFDVSESRAGSYSRRKGSPLAALSPLLVQIEKGMNAVLKGAPPSKAFRLPAEVKPTLMTELKREGVKKVSVLGMEFELTLTKRGQPVFYLRTFVHPGNSGSLLYFRGRPTKSTFGDHPPADFKGRSARRVAKAAKQFVGAIKRRCATLPFADLDQIGRMLPPGRATTRALMKAKKSRTQAPALCAELKKLGFDGYRIRIDDFSFATYKSDGKVSGMIKGDLRLRSGKLSVRVARYRDMIKGK